MLKDFLNYEFWNNSLDKWLIAVLFFIIFSFVIPFAKKSAVKTIKKISKKTKSTIDDLLVDIVKDINGLFVFAVSLYLSTQFVYLPFTVEHWLKFFVFVVVIFEIVKAVNKIITYGVGQVAEKNQDSASAIDFAGRLLKIVIWVLAGLFLMQNLGVNVSSLIAGLGIGGIAVALALQTVLGDMFSSFSIFLDKPFKAGDYISFDGIKGTVKKIGIKTTRIESLTGEEIIVANQDLTASRIQNYRKMKKRRGDFVIGVEYSTSADKLKKIKALVTNAGKKIENLEIDRVAFKEFGDFSLNFEVVFFVLSKEYKIFCEKREELNFAIHDSFEKEKIIFAFPTQTVFVEKN